jgi:uncharacterized membrane protein
MTKKLTFAGLVAGAIGIALLWVGGIAFPFYPPPGFLILCAGAVIVALVRWRWAPLVGVALGLFMIVGFLASPNGIDNLTAVHGATISVGTVVQLLGVVTAVVAGLVATVAGYRGPHASTTTADQDGLAGSVR